jgi:TetR/AcrR family transcriptional repressor of nem operon
MSKAGNTRLMILQKAFGLVYKKGFQASSIDDIIATTQVTKGAFFYHFKNKDEMGLAMINELMYPSMLKVLVEPLLAAKDPIKEIYLMMEGVLLKQPMFEVKYGCPAVNLIEEMAPLNLQFNNALTKLFNEWQNAIYRVVKEGKGSGIVKDATDEKQVAYFVMAGYSGIRNMGKILGPACYKTYLAELKNYLSRL